MGCADSTAKKPPNSREGFARQSGISRMTRAGGPSHDGTAHINKMNSQSAAKRKFRAKMYGTTIKHNSGPGGGTTAAGLGDIRCPPRAPRPIVRASSPQVVPPQRLPSYSGACSFGCIMTRGPCISMAPCISWRRVGPSVRKCFQRNI